MLYYNGTNRYVYLTTIQHVLLLLQITSHYVNEGGQKINLRLHASSNDKYHEYLRWGGKTNNHATPSN